MPDESRPPLGIDAKGKLAHLPPDEKLAIEPALTAIEWRKATGPEIERGDLIAFVWLEVGKDLVVGRRYADSKRFETVTPIAHELMALANHALPDDDPRKITRLDVEQLDSASQSLCDFGLKMLAAKLAALLPPES